MFKAATEENDELIHCFDDITEDLNTTANRWLSTLNKIFQKLFRKIRINHKKTVNIALDTLLKKKEDLKNHLTELDNLEDIQKSVDATEHLEQVLEEIAEICAASNKKIVEEHLSMFGDPLDGYNQTKTWSLKKHLSP